MVHLTPTSPLLSSDWKECVRWNRKVYEAFSSKQKEVLIPVSARHYTYCDDLFYGILRASIIRYYVMLYCTIKWLKEKLWI
jgi:hypothetical protein